MKDPVFQLCDQIRETSFALHRHLRHGHVEKVYADGLAGRLRKQGLAVTQQHPLNVFDEDGTLLGEFFADLFVSTRLIIELKAVCTLADEHVAQLLGYLRASRIEHGLLINFGSPVLQIRKYALVTPLSVWGCAAEVWGFWAGAGISAHRGFRTSARRA